MLSDVNGNKHVCSYAKEFVKEVEESEMLKLLDVWRALGEYSLIQMLSHISCTIRKDIFRIRTFFKWRRMFQGTRDARNEIS